MEKSIRKDNGNANENVGEVVIPLPNDSELPPNVAAMLDKGTNLNVSRMFALTDDLVPGIQALTTCVFKAKGIDTRLREIIILRTATLLNVPYELQANETMAKNTGVTDVQIAAIETAGPVTTLGDEINLICKATDELTQWATLSDETLSELKGRYGDSLTAKFIAIISWFNLLSRFLNGTRVPLETSDKIGNKTSPI